MTQNRVFIGKTYKHWNRGLELVSFFPAFNNDHTDSACLDELNFFGPILNDSSVYGLPFASCYFNQLEMDSNTTRQLTGDQSWKKTSDPDAVTKCFIYQKTTLRSLTVSIYNNGEDKQEVFIVIFNCGKNLNL